MTRESATVVRPAVGETRRSRREAVRRGGMTLVELMVTMVVISILASLSLAGMVSARNRAKASRTATTIRKISELILPYYEQYETRRPTITNSSSLAALPNGRTLLADAKQIAIRRLMALELPERITDFTEAFDPTAGVPTSRTASATYSGVTVTFTDMPPVTRRYYQITKSYRDGGGKPSSGELLHLIVTRGPVADPEVVAHFRDDEVRDINKNGLPEFVDGWNRPIAFQRWPIGFMSPAQPIDGTLRNIDPVLSSKGHRLVPLIFSSGPDQSYDILHEFDGRPAVSYYDNGYDPFAISASTPTQPPSLGLAPQSPAIAGSVVLAPVTGAAASGSPLVFQATRLRSGGAIAANAFQTIGSERDTGSADNDATPNGILESRDNIHNHVMTR